MQCGYYERRKYKICITSFICQGYLAFPRMGRSQGQSETAEGVASCCGLGLKSEFVVGQNGKEELDVVCAAKAGCCEGLREVVDQSPTGSSYFLCVPESLFHQDTVSHKGHNTISSVWFGRFQEFFYLCSMHRVHRRAS